MRLRRILIGIAKIKYQNNPGKRAAWEQATHIESAPHKKKKGNDDDGDGDPPPTP